MCVMGTKKWGTKNVPDKKLVSQAERGLIHTKSAKGYTSSIFCWRLIALTIPLLPIQLPQTTITASPGLTLQLRLAEWVRAFDGSEKFADLRLTMT